ncbi:hypothetical protein, partial [Acinetobacter baumannii]|uniref:hypothetical protein n=1 Tax=Acinetobacter baumannii TaxID=470 RepID=UPI001EF0C714
KHHGARTHGTGGLRGVFQGRLITAVFFRYCIGWPLPAQHRRSEQHLSADAAPAMWDWQALHRPCIPATAVLPHAPYG